MTCCSCTNLQITILKWNHKPNMRFEENVCLLILIPEANAKLLAIVDSLPGQAVETIKRMISSSNRRVQYDRCQINK